MKKDIKNLQIKLCYPVEKIFNDIVNSITDIKIDNIECPDIIFYFNNDKYVCEYNQNNQIDKYFYCEYGSFWSKFILNDSFDYSTVSILLNPMIEKHFKLNDVIAISKVFINKQMEEKYFNLIQNMFKG
jgi:hypothetical protein